MGRQEGGNVVTAAQEKVLKYSQSYKAQIRMGMMRDAADAANPASAVAAATRLGLASSGCSALNSILSTDALNTLVLTRLRLASSTVFAAFAYLLSPSRG